MSESTSPAPSAPTASKRASSRVRKQPEHYTSSPFSTGKRKRNGNDDPDDDADLDDDEPSDDDADPEDDEPAEEELKEKKSKKPRKPKTTAPKKPAQKKTKVDGVQLPIRAAAKKAPAKKRAPKKVKVANTEDAEAAGGLYAKLFAHDKTVEEAVSDWIKHFNDHEAEAMTDLINFVLKSAGCNGKVTVHDIEDPDAAATRLTDLQEEHQATEPTDYPIIAKGKSAEPFKAVITHFLNTLIRSIGANGTLCANSELIENVHVWFSTMTSASNRSFRHTSTVCSLAVLTALCDVAKDYANKKADNQRHAESERKKARPNKERVKQIEQKAKQASSDLETIDALVKDWFDTVFIHRYRDVDSHIRRDCVEAIGDWTVKLPETFFDGNHLRYIGWLLSDEISSVRLEAVKQLARLYSDDDKVGGLKTFTERFRNRMVEIGTSDADVSVRVAGLELLDLLRDNDLLEPDDIDKVGRLIFHEDFKIRRAVATFFSASVNGLYDSKVDDLGGHEALEEVILDVDEESFETPRKSWVRFKSLAEVLQAYDEDDTLPSHIARSDADGSLLLHVAGVESRFTLAVEVLYDKIPDIQGWQNVAGYLLFDHSRGRANGVGDDTLSQLKHETTLSEDEELILLEVLNASVKSSLTMLADKVTGAKSKQGKTQKDELQNEQEKAVRHLMDLIPKLLKKFGDVPKTAGAVLRLGAVLALPSLHGLRHDSEANSALLDDLRKQFMSHGSDDVLAPATAAILHAQSYGELDETALQKVASLWEDVVSNLAELLNVDTIRIRGESELEELRALSNNLLRIVRLTSVSNCISPLEDTSIAETEESSGSEYKAAIDFIIGLINRALHSSEKTPEPEEAALEDLVASRAAEAALLYFQWKLSAILGAINTGSNAAIEYEVLEALAGRRDLYVKTLENVLDSRRAGDQICVSAASCLLDLYTSSAVLRTVEPKPGMSDDYTVLITDLDAEPEKAIVKVFTAAEREFARASGKKLEEVVSEQPEEDADADPIDDDPLSEDEDEETQTQTQASQLHRDAKAMKPVILEERLCHLTTKLVLAIIAGVIDDKAVRKRLERNKAKLGSNYKEVLVYLEDPRGVKKGAKGKGKTKPKAAANGASKKGNFKSNAIVAEDEVDDEIEDAELDDEEIHRREQLDDEPTPAEDEEMVNGAADEESVLGD